MMNKAYKTGKGWAIFINIFAPYLCRKAFLSKVLNKRLSKSNKSTTNSLKLESWGPKDKTDDVSVTKSLYNTLNTGDDVNLYLKKGYLNIPWFIVTE